MVILFLSRHGLKIRYGENKGPLIIGKFETEKDIFDVLELDYKTPEQRNV